MVRSLRELEWREEKGGERGSLDEEACEQPCPKRRRRGPVRGRGRESRADRVREKERKRNCLDIGGSRYRQRPQVSMRA